MKEHGGASHDLKIPTVVPFSPDETKKFAVFDAADIISVVGLVSSFKKVSGHNRNMTIKESRYLQVIRPTMPFNHNMKVWAGKISNL